MSPKDKILGPSKREYSTSSSNSSNLDGIDNNESIKFDSINPDFIEWFRGFVDGEGNFSIIRDHNTFAFVFQIKLHIDDINLLHFIKSNLKMGNVRSYPLYGVFLISKQREVQVLIEIFSNHPLNTTKYLNFVAWAKGFNLLQNYKITKDTKFLDAIANLKAEMNNSRTDFNMPSDYSINITAFSPLNPFIFIVWKDSRLEKAKAQWFMGFFEGEGSVFVSRKDYTLSISIGQALIDKYVMLKVAEFLNQLPGAKSVPFGSGENAVKIYCSEGSLGHARGKIELVISQVNFIKSVMIPFFNSQPWYGKKYLDFIDFQTIFSACFF